MVQEQWLQLKMFLLFLLGWIDCWWGGNKNSVGRWGGGMSRFSAGGGDSPHPPSMENLIYIYIYKLYILYILYIYIFKRTLPRGYYIQWRSSVYVTYIMCQNGHLTFARIEHFVCQLHMLYVFTSLFSVRNTINLSRHEHI